MTDKTHLEELAESISAPLPKKLVETFIQCHASASLSAADVVIRLKERMEDALNEDADATAPPHRS
jgi:hypothetical protein